MNEIINTTSTSTEKVIPWYIKDLKCGFNMVHIFDDGRVDVTAQAYDNVFNIIYKLRRNNQWNELRELLKSLKGDEDQKLLAAIIYQTRIYPEIAAEVDRLFTRFMMNGMDKDRVQWIIHQNTNGPARVERTHKLIESDKSE